jgi:hypothetical protein
LKSGLVTATITAPPQTEVLFGISEKDSVDWRDYQVIDLDKSFLLNGLYDQFKVGIKFNSTSPSVAAEVDGFAVMLSGDLDNEINVMYQSSSSSEST